MTAQRQLSSNGPRFAGGVYTAVNNCVHYRAADRVLSDGAPRLTFPWWRPRICAERGSFPHGPSFRSPLLDLARRWPPGRGCGFQGREHRAWPPCRTRGDYWNRRGRATSPMLVGRRQAASPIHNSVRPESSSRNPSGCIRGSKTRGRGRTLLLWHSAITPGRK